MAISIAKINIKAIFLKLIFAIIIEFAMKFAMKFAIELLNKKT